MGKASCEALPSTLWGAGPGGGTRQALRLPTPTLALCADPSHKGEGNAGIAAQSFAGKPGARRSVPVASSSNLTIIVDQASCET